MEEGPQDFCTGESEMEEGGGREQDKALTAIYSSSHIVDS